MPLFAVNIFTGKSGALNGELFHTHACREQDLLHHDFQNAENSWVNRMGFKNMEFSEISNCQSVKKT